MKEKEVIVVKTKKEIYRKYKSAFQTFKGHSSYTASENLVNS